MQIAMFVALLIQSVQPTVGEMKYMSDQTRDVYIHGALAAWGWANADLEYRGLPSLYCPPPKLGLTTDQADSILRVYAGDPLNAVNDDHDYAMILLLALEDTFPCPSSASAPLDGIPNPRSPAF